MPVVRLFSSARAPIKRWLTRRAPQTVAAVDLGSNSFHMIVARVMNGQFHVMDRLQEMARLAAGLCLCQLLPIACVRTWRNGRRRGLKIP